MSLIDIRYPGLIHASRDARNAMFPDTNFYAQAVGAENHIVAFRKKEVFSHRGYMNDGATDINGFTGAVNAARWRFRTGYGTTRLVARVVLGNQDPGGGTDPYISISVTVPGGATSNFSPDMHSGLGGSGDDAPNSWKYFESSVDVDANQTYEGLLVTNDYVRVISLSIYEESDQHVDATYSYYNEQVPQAKAKIYQDHRERLAQGLTNMWLRNGGLQCNAGRYFNSGTGATLTSATATNFIETATTGTPTANTPGWTLDLAYRATVSGAGVPCVLAVYGSMSSGSGTVRVTDTSGTSPISVTVNNATPQWFTATGNLVASNGKKYDPMFLSDGSNTLTVYAVSLYEADSA